MMTEPRHLLYRCYKCGALITSLQIQDIWRSSTGEAYKHPPLCACGSSHISPGNAKWWEELIYPSIWKLWYHKVFLPWLKAKTA